MESLYLNVVIGTSKLGEHYTVLGNFYAAMMHLATEPSLTEEDFQDMIDQLKNGNKWIKSEYEDQPEIEAVMKNFNRALVKVLQMFAENKKGSPLYCHR